MIQIGNRYRCSEPLKVTVWLAIGAPVTIMGDEVLPAGEPFIVIRPDIYGDVECRPVNYDQLHEHFVPEAERARVNKAYFNQYEGYYLLIPPEVITTQCEQVAAE